MSLLHLKFGPILKEPVLNEFISEKSKEKFQFILLPKMRKIISEQRKGIYNKKEVPLLDSSEPKNKETKQIKKKKMN